MPVVPTGVCMRQTCLINSTQDRVLSTTGIVDRTVGVGAALLLTWAALLTIMLALGRLVPSF